MEQTVQLNKTHNSTQSKRLHTFFLESAARYPEVPAISVGVRELTYADVEDTARRWASSLLEACPTAPKRVGILAYRSEVGYIGVLATLFAGGTFVPLNPTFPAQRTRSMMELAALDALIVDGNSLKQLTEVIESLRQIHVVLLPETDTFCISPIGVRVLNQADLEKAKPLQQLPSVPDYAHAYLLFTSGSTGQPKGVPITHANVVHFLEVNQRRYQLTHEDRLSQTFDQTFDLSIFDLFMAWGSGACVCAIQPIQLLSPFRVVREKNITVWFSVPSVISLLRKKNLLKPGSLLSLRLSLFCGEALTKDSVEAWQSAAPNSIIENLYGPTELTIACAAYRWHPEHSQKECFNGIVPIGRVYENLHDLVVDENLQPVLSGEDGELCVAGAQTFPGYWNDFQKTALSTFTRSDQHGNKLRYYRTGDRVRLVENNYIYLGRMDRQIKVLGYRVDLGDVEATLRAVPGVIEAVALGWPVNNEGSEGIIAFVSGNLLNVELLTAKARNCLPAYMVPRTIHVLDNMPLNANGKVARNLLYEKLGSSGLSIPTKATPYFHNC
jgi:amino acid adenylation domain-containing protein